MIYSLLSEAFHYKKRPGQWGLPFILSAGFVLGILYIDWIHPFYSDQFLALAFPHFARLHSLLFSLSLWVLSFIFIRLKLSSAIYFLGLIKSFLLSCYIAFLYKEFGPCSFLFVVFTDFTSFISTIFLFIVWFGILEEKFLFSRKIFVLGIILLPILFLIEAVLIYPFYFKLFLLL